MKKYLIILLSLISIFNMVAQSSAEEANIAYKEGDFDTTINLLEKEVKGQLKGGKASADLYYNLGNAYFKKNELAKAILNYERALLLNPNDLDIKHNIDFVNKKIEDKIEIQDHSFLVIGFDYLRSSLSSNDWAILSIVLFVLFIVFLILFIFTQKVFFRKTGFYTAITLAIFLIFTNIFAYKQKEDIKHRETAIIMTPISNIMSSPSNTSNLLFTLHEGTKVFIKKADQNWIEIQIADGKRGWVDASKLEII